MELLTMDFALLEARGSPPRRGTVQQGTAAGTFSRNILQIGVAMFSTLVPQLLVITLCNK